MGYDLVIFDFYDTIVQLKDYWVHWVLREGIEELLDALSDRILAVCSDAGEEKIAGILGSDAKRFFGIYGHSNLVDFGSYKDLERICLDAGVPTEKTVFIGDNRFGLDRRSAERYGIDFIQVPNGGEKYDFSQLIDVLDAR